MSVLAVHHAGTIDTAGKYKTFTHAVRTAVMIMAMFVSTIYGLLGSELWEKAEDKKIEDVLAGMGLFVAITLVLWVL